MKKNIALITGGKSSEFKISLESANVVMNNLDKGKYNPYLIVIDGHNWKYNDNNREVLIDKNDFSLILNNKKIKFDCVFIIIHGNPGENGKLQGYFDMLDIPYTTSGVLTSALTFNKFFCKKYLESFNILTAKSLMLTKNEELKIDNILEHLQLPLFVKPNNGGSSYGISKVKTIEEIMPAIKKAFDYDDEIIIEEYISGRELTCGVFRRNKQVEALPITEIISKNEYFDTEAKYEQKSDEITPANVSSEITFKCQEISKIIYQKLQCKGIARIDYILKENNLYFLEINTIPGMTKESIVPKQAQIANINTMELYNILIEEALN
jgi:D-alanine-D-alanine ligase